MGLPALAAHDGARLRRALRRLQAIGLALSVTRAAALTLAYAALTLLVTSPIVDLFALDRASYEGDARLLIWTLAWDGHALLSGAPLFGANIYHPEPQALAFAEHHLGIAVFALPGYAASDNPVLAYWTVWLAAFPLNALAMYALAWRITRDRAAAFAAGCVYAFCFFRMHHAHGHIQLLWTWALPLVPLALDRWLERATWPRAAAWTGLVVLQAITSWYVAVFVALLGAVSLIALMPGRRLARAHLVQGLAMAGAGVIVLAPLARPYFELPPGPVAEAASNAADAGAYLLPPENTWLGQWLRRQSTVPVRPIWGERTLYVGAAVIVLAVLGCMRLVSGLREMGRRESQLTAAVLVTGALALALSFGSSSIAPTPFDLMTRLPGMALLRAPARFALLVMMAAALMAAFGVSWFRRRWPRIWWMPASALGMVFFAESFVVAFPAGKPAVFEPPAAYRRLASLPRGAVLSLPTYRATAEAFREADYLLFSTAHWQPIVNGFGRAEPPAHAARMEVLQRFPAADAIALMRRLGVRYVVLHPRRASELAAQVQAAAAEPAVRLLDSTDGDFLYEIVERSANEVR